MPGSMLIVGGDGLIGSRLAPVVKQNGFHVFSTSRRATANGSLIQYDLLAGEHRRLQELGADVAILCAAMTNMRACENDPVTSGRINVDETVRLAEGLLAAGTFVMYLSSNTVFSGRNPWPQENSPRDPTIAYGRQKAEAEKQLLAIPGADRNLAIVRLSKVVSGDSGMALQFIGKLQAGDECVAFSDLMCSPVSLCYVTRQLVMISRAHQAGIFHLSGAAELSYTEFARAIAHRMGDGIQRVRPVEAASVGVEVLFKPRHPGLGMAETTKRFGIEPEPLATTIDGLFAADI